MQYRAWVGAALVVGLSGLARVQSAPAFPVATVEDAIRMERIQHSAAADGSVAAISPDGKRAAAVTWHGDLGRNVNVYTLVVFDIGEGGVKSRAPEKILARDFKGDPDDQQASPFEKLAFLGDNRTIAFIGRDGASQQVFTVDTLSKSVSQLTHSGTPVRSFVVGAEGDLQAFSAVASPGKGELDARLDDDAVFMWDTHLFPFQISHFADFPLLWQHGGHQIRQYFRIASGQAELLFDSRRSRPAEGVDLSDPEVAKAPTATLEDETALSGLSTLTGDPSDQYVLLFPYGLTEHPMHAERYRPYYDDPHMNAYARRVAAPYGLVDLSTGQIDRLIDAPHPPFERNESGNPLWARDGRSIIVYTLLPDALTEAPKWVEVDIATRKVTPLGLPKEWRPIAWAADGRGLVLNGKGGHIGSLSRLAGGGWGSFADFGVAEGFDPDWAVATNGRVVIGVKDASLTAPELTAFNLATRKVNLLTDLNPSLRERRYGQVELVHWQNAHETDATGFLVKPVGYQPGTRYPLVILLDDGTLHREGEPFLLDASWQLNGHAIQMLAAQGFMVLYPREPSLREVIETAEEGKRICEHIESAVAKLDHDGLIDPKRVGVSGWSRAGYYTDYLLIHSSIPFAAATAMDGGGSEYNEGLRPFTDDELKHVRTPLLYEAHGLASLAIGARMLDRLGALGKPTDILYIGGASHSTTRPLHRLRSLGTHIDWWRFWLMGQENPDPAKAEQYAHWRRLREMHAP